ncbi:MAG: EscU/YscU/HrcU family type III secretion system export apparatus switch protein [Gammaproteobacteria bacterium]|nr:EscU/YscU/HrcU family type III secretion system export apparatus switch protein [Gammaproteobacteria bacterium]
MSDTNNTSPPPRRELAVALKYDGAHAPRVTAKGSGQIAEQIVALALEHNIPMQENALMAQTLSQLELNEEIPPALYLAVAEIIAFAYYLSGKVPGR